MQLWSKHSSGRSHYLHTVKKAITELSELDIDDPAASRPRAEYLLEEGRFTYPPRHYGVAFQNFPEVFQTVVGPPPSNSADRQFLLNS